MKIFKMNYALYWLGFILFWTLTGVSWGNEHVYRFELESKSIQCKYTIEVVVPADMPAPGTKYPVVYCMDWFILSDFLKSLPRMMELGDLVEPYFLVGISQGTNQDDWAIMRTRDFTPDHPSDDYSIQNMYPKAVDLTGGAAKFTNFLKDELLPCIESKYPCDPNRRCFVGYSLGGLLGINILKENPQMFQYYLLGSPSLWFNNYFLAMEIEKVSVDQFQSIKKVYLSVGENESWEMLKGFAMVRDAFRAKGFDDSRVKTEIIKANGHVGSIPIALYDGIRFLFGTPK